MSVTALHRISRVGPGRYRVPSETTAGRAYSVQVSGERGDCDCQGAEGAYRKGHQCKHIKAAIAEERTHMGTELTTRTPDLTPAVVEYTPTLPTTDEMRVMVTIANSVYKTAGKLIPSNIKSSEEAFAVMLAGKELGLGPMESFREVYVINGRTQPSARVLMGMVLRGDASASFRWLERSASRACVQLRRSGRDTIEVEYTMEDAKRAGLADKEVWKQHPKDMLAYKAVTRACRLGGPDLITAIGASVRGAPAVMRAIDDAIDADAEEVPSLEPIAPEPVSEGDYHARVCAFLKEARDTWDAESHKAMLVTFDKAFPGSLAKPSGNLMLGNRVKAQTPAMWGWINANYGAGQPAADDLPYEAADDGAEQGELV